MSGGRLATIIGIDPIPLASAPNSSSSECSAGSEHDRPASAQTQCMSLQGALITLRHLWHLSQLAHSCAKQRVGNIEYTNGLNRSA